MTVPSPKTSRSPSVVVTLAPGLSPRSERVVLALHRLEVGLADDQPGRWNQFGLAGMVGMRVADAQDIDVRGLEPAIGQLLGKRPIERRDQSAHILSSSP